MFYSAFIHIIHYTVLSFWDKSDADYTIHKRDVYELYSQKKKVKNQNPHTPSTSIWENYIKKYYLCLMFYLAFFFWPENYHNNKNAPREICTNNAKGAWSKNE